MNVIQLLLTQDFVPYINKTKSYIETASPTWIDGSTREWGT